MPTYIYTYNQGKSIKKIITKFTDPKEIYALIIKNDVDYVEYVQLKWHTDYAIVEQLIVDPKNKCEKLSSA